MHPGLLARIRWSLPTSRGSHLGSAEVLLSLLNPAVCAWSTGTLASRAWAI